MRWSITDFIFLEERFWLPEGVTWADVQKSQSPGGIKPLGQHFLIVLFLSLSLLLVRYFVYKIIYRPIGRYFLINDRVVPPPERNEVGERLFKKCKGFPKEAEISQLKDATQWSERHVERWFRQRRLSALPNKMVKFTDSAWRFTGYIILLIVGLIIIPRKDYFYDVSKAWTNYPQRDVPADEFWYYMFEMSYYLSLTISHCFEQRKKDFWEMMIHHIATIGLISLSFYVNYIRIGALIMLCHDLADPWLELAKTVHYTRHKREMGTHYVKDKLTELCFILFAALFFVSRLYVFPVYLIYSVYVSAYRCSSREIKIDCPEHYGPWPMHIVFLTLLCTLYVLHIFWSVMICKVISKSILSGHVKGDSRSDDEMTTDDDTATTPDSPVTRNHNNSGKAHAE